MKEQFINHLKEKMGKFYSNSITEAKLVKRKKLYGFDNKKEHKFIFIEFANLNANNIYGYLKRNFEDDLTYFHDKDHSYHDTLCDVFTC